MNALDIAELAEWELRVNLTHAQQIDQLGWCICEGTDGQGQLANDCPPSPIMCGDCIKPLSDCGCLDER